MEKHVLWEWAQTTWWKCTLFIYFFIFLANFENIWFMLWLKPGYCYFSFPTSQIGLRISNSLRCLSVFACTPAHRLLSSFLCVTCSLTISGLSDLPSKSDSLWTHISNYSMLLHWCILFCPFHWSIIRLTGECVCMKGQKHWRMTGELTGPSHTFKFWEKQKKNMVCMQRTVDLFVLIKLFWRPITINHC